MRRLRLTGSTLGWLALVLLAAPAVLASDAVTETGPVTFLGVGTAATDGGLRVTQVIPGSAAETAGLRGGDVIVEFAGQQVTTPQQLATLVRSRASGARVELMVSRDGARELLSAELGHREVGPNLRIVGDHWIWSQSTRGRVKDGAILRKQGMRRDNIYLCPADENCRFDKGATWYRGDCMERGCPTFEVRYYGRPVLGIELDRSAKQRNRQPEEDEPKGVLVGKIKEGSPAEYAGILVGDLIVAADGVPTPQLETLGRIVRASKGGNLEIEVWRSGRTRNLRAWIEKPGPAGPVR